MSIHEVDALVDGGRGGLVGLGGRSGRTVDAQWTMDFMNSVVHCPLLRITVHLIHSLSAATEISSG